MELVGLFLKGVSSGRFFGIFGNYSTFKHYFTDLKKISDLF
jgi:hypothetical protein